MKLKAIQKELGSFATPEAKSAALKFVPGALKVYGIRMPALNELAKKYKDGGFELIQKLWESGAFEERVLAAKMLGLVCKKDPAFALQLVEKFSKDISDWAICDTLGMQSLKPVAAKMQQEVFSLSARLMYSKNPWQRRLSLVIIEVYTKDQSVHKEIRKRIKVLEKDEEYYVKKSVEWLKRNLKKGK